MQAPADNVELGRRIKQLRLAQGYTLKDIESKVGVSATHVSEVERGKTSPTVGALGKIADALDVNPSFLVDIPVGETVSITRGDERVVLIGPNENARWEILTSENPYAELSLFVLVLEADMKKPLVRTPRPGDKFMHVISGIIEVELSEEKFLLRKGDSIHFKSSMPLKILNLSDSESRIFWADWPRYTL
ncbi:MAG: helix-turn-helix transcriptional regulator [Candidatus Eisenbacteria bacterium]|uniref:Helix-turn-helix transcriptional regulator n=1 Tax=Eiseniibacteriota bacterium TaxID=2212470 RepID=A0A7Y2H1G2_UNCEI|nr:helix-turn-helix transcriptional regulator [Candidatus Eisenbacteria bacterium]